MKEDEQKALHKSFSNLMFASGVVMIFIALSRIDSATGYALLAATSATLFYFWWGYLFLAEKYANKGILDYAYDFVIFGFVVAMIQLMSLEMTAPWLFVYLALFVGAIFKYVIIMAKGGKDVFFERKIKIDGVAALFVTAVIVLSYFTGSELFAVLMIFFMEFAHILYAGFTGFYEKA